MKLNKYDIERLENIYEILENEHRTDLSKELKRIIRKIKPLKVMLDNRNETYLTECQNCHITNYNSDIIDNKCVYCDKEIQVKNIDCNKCNSYEKCDHQGAYKKDGKWCYE